MAVLFCYERIFLLTCLKWGNGVMIALNSLLRGAQTPLLQFKAAPNIETLTVPTYQKSLNLLGCMKKNLLSRESKSHMQEAEISV